MKIKVQVVIETEGSNEVVQEVMQLKRGALRVEEFGLTLAEAKPVLQACSRPWWSNKARNIWSSKPPVRSVGRNASKEPPRRLLLGLHIERSLELPNLFRSCQAHANLPTSARSSAPRTRAPFLPRHYPASSVV